MGNGRPLPPPPPPLFKNAIYRSPLPVDFTSVGNELFKAIHGSVTSDGNKRKNFRPRFRRFRDGRSVNDKRTF